MSVTPFRQALRGSTVLVLLALSAPVAAQETWTGLMPQAKPAASPAGLAGRVDDTALRAAAARNDVAAVAAEIRRLRSENPNWVPPQDLTEGTQDPAEEQRLWALFAQGKWDEIAAVTAAIQASRPQWRPSPAFTTKFEAAKARRLLMAASEGGRAAEVVAIAAQQPALLVCAEMDVLWRVAEALAGTGASDKAFDLYGFILGRCPDLKERLATVEKAALVLPPDRAETLLAMGLQSKDASAFDGVRRNVLRNRLARAIDGGAFVAPAEIASFESSALQARQAEDVMLVGWLRYARKEMTAAAADFEAAMAMTGSPKAIEGYVLSQRAAGNVAVAERTAYERRAVDPSIARLYIEILATDLTRNPRTDVDPARIARLEPVIAETRSAVGSQALGWYLYNGGRFPEALRWFRDSIAIEPMEANALGLALTANRLKDATTFRQTVAAYGPHYPAVAALKTLEAGAARTAKGGTVPGARTGGGGVAASLAREAVEQFKAGQYDAALATLDRRRKAGPEDRGLAVLRGWALYQSGQYVKAKALFEDLDRQQSTRDTQYGTFYANQQLLPPQFRTN